MNLPKFAKAVFTIVFLFITFPDIYSQTGWFDLNVPGVYKCLYFISDQTGCAVGSDGKIIKTTNGGINWVEKAVHSAYVLNSIYFPSSSVGYTMGFCNCGGSSPILKTSDGGSNWVLQNSNTNVILTSVYFITNDNGWIVGDSSVILHTANGGENWSLESSGGSNYYTCVQFVSASTGWITGRSTILKTTNAGVNWINQPAPAYSQIWEARFPTPSIGYAVCGNYYTGQGFVLKTTNGGNNWDSLNISTNSYLIYLSFVNENLGWLTGFDGMILRTTNGGINWEQQTNGQIGWLQSIQFVNSTTGWLTGNYSIFKTVTGGVIGITPITNEVPEEFALYQNYPNPFNPATTIKFDLPKEANVKITLFDIVGREILTMANEFKKAGSYKLDFDGNAISSGTYFYRLETNEFTDTKKMVLIK